MNVFDGNTLAQKKEIQLKKEVSVLLSQGKKLKIAAILFTEDHGSQIYTQLKKEAAERVGIGYEVFSFSLLDSPEKIQKKLSELNQESGVTGIIIQKPWRQTWLDAKKSREEVVAKSDFDKWWLFLVSKINEKKDVDGLHPSTLEAIKNGDWRERGRVMPATAKAVLEILQQAFLPERANEEEWKFWSKIVRQKIIIIGKSDLLGKPLFYELTNKGCEVEMIGSKELKERMEHGEKLLNSDVVISATGRNKLVTGEMIRDGVIVIDVGEPKPDIDFESVSQKASFITPVPGGVGPMTVVSLLGNCVELYKN